MRYLLTALACLLFSAQSANAAVDPRLAPNNKFGINSLSPEAETQEVANLVNTNGDWGWAVIVIGKNDRNLEKWQKVFNKFNDYHITPIVRLSTHVDSAGNWQKPTDADAREWAQFLNDLYWPVKNRYVQIYNEVNRGSEWGKEVDPSGYAVELNKTINLLKEKSGDFFILNAPLDLALATSRDTLEAAAFYQGMETRVPGIFEKLDGWASHSYPNPDFSASPLKSGRTGIDGYRWELAQIKNFTDKNLPVFITETGWKNTDLPEGEDLISENYGTAFSFVWSDAQVVAVAPFVFNYPDNLFKEFSFKRGDTCTKYCVAIQNFPKVKGRPARENTGEILTFDHTKIAVINTPVDLDIELKNTGNHVWNTKDLKISATSADVIVEGVVFKEGMVYPGETVVGTVQIKTTKQAVIPFTLQITDGDRLVAQKESSLQGETYVSLVMLGIRTIISNLNV